MHQHIYNIKQMLVNHIVIFKYLSTASTQYILYGLWSPWPHQTSHRWPSPVWPILNDG